MDEFHFLPVPLEEIEREKRKARELRRTQWWKNKRASGRCHYCGRTFPARELTMDHIVPLVRGGKSVKANVVPCCKECNDQKKYLLPLEWEAYLEHLRQESDNRAAIDPLTGAPAPPPGPRP
jgi:5-methylcytosine-specific restriction endonuclease McrA